MISTVCLDGLLRGTMTRVLLSRPKSSDTAFDSLKPLPILAIIIRQLLSIVFHRHHSLSFYSHRRYKCSSAHVSSRSECHLTACISDPIMPHKPVSIGTSILFAQCPSPPPPYLILPQPRLSRPRQYRLNPPFHLETNLLLLSNLIQLPPLPFPPHLLLALPHKIPRATPSRPRDRHLLALRVPWRADLWFRGRRYGGGIGGLGECAFFLEFGGLVPVSCAASAHVRVVGGLLGGWLGGLRGGSGCAVSLNVL